jgi:hypothetical protein
LVVRAAVKPLDTERNDQGPPRKTGAALFFCFLLPVREKVAGPAQPGLTDEGSCSRKDLQPIGCR